ncbi:hypothetical protein [Pseudomonas sp. FP198]|uniref:hypothetical protein n=1 Tax=Pseudomonas sp. FP198 TaxID=2954084 RepID=UPI002734E649|nr:hypothetical protein [Pseudomonas sp. FP198]WLG93581.1 hypothetical protein PSH78_14225 [Pseudomonas sp. FP198]
MEKGLANISGSQVGGNCPPSHGSSVGDLSDSRQLIWRLAQRSTFLPDTSAPNALNFYQGQRVFEKNMAVNRNQPLPIMLAPRQSPPAKDAQ